MVDSNIGWLVSSALVIPKAPLITVVEDNALIHSALLVRTWALGIDKYSFAASRNLLWGHWMHRCPPLRSLIANHLLSQHLGENL